MSRFSDNIRYLRTQKGVSQESIALSLGITRTRYATYEDGRTEPPYDILNTLAVYHHISIDLLITVDVRKIALDQLLKMDDNRILLPIITDKNGDKAIEIIPHSAKAGYLTGYRDPEFIESLQQISLPFLRNGLFRGFPIDGDSMPPLQSGSIVIGEYVEKLKDIKNGETYILLTKTDGIIYKRVTKTSKGIMLHSDNDIYEPYEVKSSEILEVWKYACSLLPNAPKPDNNAQPLEKMVAKLVNDMQIVKDKVRHLN